MSKIEWTDHTVNVQVGCSRVSPGCTSCYAERQANALARRFPKAAGARYLPVVDGEGGWSRDVVLDQAMLERGPQHPQRKRDGDGWRSPRVFLGSMTDHFHEKVTAEMFLSVVRYMARRPDTIWQLVTKRPERAAELLDWAGDSIHMAATGQDMWPRIHLLATVEDQQRADERIPHLLACRPYVELVGLSVEPMLGPVVIPNIAALGWVICGGESGPGARQCSVEWIRDVVGQCHAANVPCFVKQMGANATEWRQVAGVNQLMDPGYKHPKGGDWSEWPEDLRVREFPA